MDDVVASSVVYKGKIVNSRSTQFHYLSIPRCLPLRRFQLYST